MAVYQMQVRFTYETTVQVEADSAALAEAMFMNADAAAIAHINGKSFASVDESAREILNIVEVT